MGRQMRYASLVAIAMWIRLGTPVAAAIFPDSCQQNCTSESDCSQTCYATLEDFINDTATTCGNWGVCNGGGNGNGNGDGNGGPCGDGQCNNNETCDSCPQDCYAELCGTCGDGQCEANEYGGAGSGHPVPAGCTVQNNWCRYCPEDCNGSCSQYYCDPQACDYSGDYLYQCRPCQTGADCAYSDEYCWGGLCYIGTTQCLTNAECAALGSGDWKCTANHVCGPPGSS